MFLAGLLTRLSIPIRSLVWSFFFQAEDGIRDVAVTGVQTCALPILIRNRGTVCGSLAHADPASELPAVLLALGGHAVARSTRGERTIPADQLFSGLFETTLAPDEMVVEAWFPASGRPFAILEESRRHGDFALAGVVRADGKLALFGVASR